MQLPPGPSKRSPTSSDIDKNARRAKSIEAKASRVIICKFLVKLPFPVYSGLQRASTSRHIHSDGVPGWPAGIVRMCQYVFALYVFGLRSVMTTALDSDERLV